MFQHLLRDGERVELTVAAAHSSGAVVLALTSARLLAIRRGDRSPAQDAILSEIAVADVDSIEVEPARMGSRKRITVGAPGGSFALESHWRTPAEDLPAALRRAKEALRLKTPEASPAAPSAS